MMLLQVACACALVGSSWAAQADTRAEGGQEIDLTNIPHVLNNLEVAFNHWLTLNPRSYSSDQPEVLAQRLNAFKSNAQFVHAHNNEHPSTVLHLNRFADLTFEEFQQDHLGLDMSMKTNTPSSVRLDGFRHANVAAPESVDWTEVGAVTPIKNQGQCGSCWAFSTTGAIEGVNYVKTGTLVSLSEQELVDCDSNGDHGCNGGLMDHAFKYVVDNGGIDTEEDYRYWGSALSFCNRRKQADRHVVKISGFEDVPAEDEGALAQAVAAQPVAVGICANRALQLYHSGVFDGECCTQLNHGVLAVGYGEEDGKKFWKVKNSWGSAWGEEGYFKLQKDLGGEGQCGIATYASYPVKDHDTNPHVPTICDAQLFSWWECPYETTCRCDFNLFGLLCLAYECEPKNAVACGGGDDSYCPSKAPDCDAASQWCTSSDGLSSPMLNVVPAQRRTA